MEETTIVKKTMYFIGEAALSSFLGQLFDKLFSFALDFVAEHRKVHKQLKQWKSKLSYIQTVLNDAEEKQIKAQHVKNWLADLQDLAYDVDDTLDEFAYEALRLKLRRSQAQASTSSDNTTSFWLTNRMVPKIKKITSRMDDLIELRDSLGLSEMSEGASSKGNKSRLQRASVMDKAVKYVGREDEKKEILGLLKSSNLGGEDGVSVISIVGMGGIGKTTLAQLVYNHPMRQEDSFTHKAWVCVSDDFDAFKITKTILKSVTSESCDDDDFNLLQIKLQKELSGKKLLLVLDDIWNVSCNDWTILRSPFAAGTKIIVTTRFANVSSNVDAVKSFHLDRLSFDDCLSIFTQYALRARDFNQHPELKEVGENIVRKCSGLPLAAKVIGRLLRTSKNHDSWEKISEREIWELQEDPEDPSGIIPALQLSYHYLPSHLKRCFAYCSILPKGHQFEEEEIILLWRAEGLLKQNGENQINDFGSQCFQDLVSRSFFQMSSNDKSRFEMHDLINDLAQSVAGGGIYCKLKDDVDQQKFSNRTRYLSYVGSKYDGKKKFEAFYQVTLLRTFLPLKEGSRNFLTPFVLTDLLPEFKCLRVLSLNGYCITELPADLFKDLKHVHYLDFSNNEIKVLPNSLCTLYHLETLILRGCKKLEKFPPKFENLVELHYLDITGADSIKEIPPGISELTKLQRLSNFILREGGGYHIRSLKNLSNLRGDFCLSGLKNVKGEDAREAKLMGKPGIDRLELQWSTELGNDTRNEEDEEKRVLGFLRPHKKLKQLIIANYGGTEFSAWIADSSFNNLLSLELRSCKNCKLLPSVGKLPQLRDLSISGFNEVANVGDKFFGEDQLKAFVSLETLHFEGLPNWKEWDPCEGDEQVSKFPKLRELCIKNCPQLERRLPSRLHSLQKLEIDNCTRLVVSISSFPSLCELKINGCQELEDERSANQVTPLQRVSLSDIANFRIPSGRKKSRFTNLEHFEINGWEELPSLPQNGLRLNGHRSITITGCPRLVSLETRRPTQMWKILGIEALTIDSCERLNRLPEVLHALKFLKEMRIMKCPSLVNVAENNLPPTLESLVINHCENLEYLVEESNHSSISNQCLERLEILHCPSIRYLCDVPNGLRHLNLYQCSKLTSLFFNGKLPGTLKRLQICYCPELECIAQDFHETTGLQFFKLLGSHKIPSLPRGFEMLSHLLEIKIEEGSSTMEESRLPPATKLRVLSISGLENFGSLFNCLYRFTSLRELRLLNCSAEVSRGFPTNLTSLEISKAPRIYRSLVEWGLDRLTSLRSLDISGEGCTDVETFPEENRGMMLPPSLTSIYIKNFENLKRMSSRGFQNLTSLQSLSIISCCKLANLPEQELLLSVGKLQISSCPLLKQNCRRNRGSDWPKIDHIPSVDIDSQIIIP